MVSKLTGKECCECISETGEHRGVMGAVLATTKLTMIAHESYVGGGGFLQEQGWVVKPQRSSDIFTRRVTSGHLGSCFVALSVWYFPAVSLHPHYCLFHLSDGFLACGKNNY